MPESFSSLRVNPARLLDTVSALSLIGAMGGHGSHRYWFRAEAENAGLKFYMDGAGNHSVLQACGDENAPTLLLGSHLNSVPNGGPFDGALGVVVALEVLKTVKENGIRLRRNLALPPAQIHDGQASVEFVRSA